MIEIPKSNAREEQENELAQWVLDNLKKGKKYRYFREPKAAVLVTGQDLCRTKTNGMHLRSKRLITLCEHSADKDMLLQNVARCVIQVHI